MLSAGDKRTHICGFEKLNLLGESGPWTCLKQRVRMVISRYRFFDFQMTVTNLKQLNKNGEFVRRRKILHRIQSHILGVARRPPGWAGRKTLDTDALGLSDALTPSFSLLSFSPCCLAFSASPKL